MGKYKKYKNRLEKFLQSEAGRRFFNYAYSIGAAIVILGALFKILHLPFGNLLLSIGMATEALMFTLSAFDHPAKDYDWEQVFPVLGSKDPEDRPDFSGGNGTVIIGNGKGGSVTTSASGVAAITPEAARQAAGLSGIQLEEEDSKSLTESIQKLSAAADQLSRMAELTDATQQYLNQLSSISDEMNRLRNATQSLTEVSNVLLNSYQSITDNSDGISEHSQGYVTQMENLNRNIAGLNTIYEIQLKSISSQLDCIDRVNVGLKSIRDMYEHSVTDSSRYCEETEKMTQYMKQLNKIYEKMLTAMTVNMYSPMGQRPMAAEPAPTEQVQTETGIPNRDKE